MLQSCVSDEWIMAVINLQMCYIREQSLAATQTTGKTVVEKVFIAALFVLQRSFASEVGRLREALEGEIKIDVL